MPIHISTAADLVAMALDLTADYILDNDIDMSLEADWVPLGDFTDGGMGNYGSVTPFTGTFDGQGFTITGLKINHTTPDYSILSVGMFGVVRGGQISNLNLVNVSVNGSETVGSLVGSFFSGVIENCTVEGLDLTTDTPTYFGFAHSYIGGFVGRLGPRGDIGAGAETAVISNCSVAGSMNAQYGFDIGGFVGVAATLRIASAEITDCTANVSLDSNPSTNLVISEVGGFASGLAGASSKPLTVSGCNCQGAMNGTGSVGGFSGSISTNVAVSDCFSICDVDAVDFCDTGGFVSEASGDVTIENCHFSGSITGEPSFCGGFVAYCFDVTIDQCFVEATMADSDYTNGGFAGEFDDGLISNCYAHIDLSQIADGSGITGGFVADFYGDGTIQNCYASGTVACPNGGGYVGGFVGWAENACVIENCFSVGVVTSDNEPYGGFAGQVDTDVTLTNCAWWTGALDWAIGTFDTGVGFVNHVALADYSFGTDELDADLLKHKEHAVYAQGT